MPDFGSDRNIPRCKVAWQHHRHTTVAVLWLQQLDGRDVRVEYMSTGSTELDKVGCPYLEVWAVGRDRDDNTAPPWHIEYGFNFEEKPYSVHYARKAGSGYIEPEHILEGLLLEDPRLFNLVLPDKLCLSAQVSAAQFQRLLQPVWR